MQEIFLFLQSMGPLKRIPLDLPITGRFIVSACSVPIASIGQHNRTQQFMELDLNIGQAANAKSKVRSMLDEQTFEHVTVDVELDGEQCVASDGHDHRGGESDSHSHHH